MYRDQGGASRSEIGAFDRKRINDVLDKQLDKSTPSFCKAMNGKGKDRFSVPSTSVGKQLDLRSLSKNKSSDRETCRVEGQKPLLGMEDHTDQFCFM